MKRASSVVTACAAALFGIAVAGTNGVAQEGTNLTGRVVGEGGQPLASVNVTIDGTNLGTLTNDQGRYLLMVPASETGREVTVRANLIGYRSQAQTVRLDGGSLTIDFTLGLDPLQLEQIVVTGVGQETTRERLGVSISSVEGEEVTRVSTPNVVTALAAKAPGVQITSSAGDPGASSFIRVRGVNTLEGAGQPLFVVDGVPVNNAETFLPSSVQYGVSTDLAGTANPNRLIDLNPNDIASIEILKGASASAIYGARAANGVVLITTTRGGPGGTGTRASLETSVALDEVNRAIPLQTRFGQGTGGESYTEASDFPANLRSWGPELSPDQTYDHWGELFELGQRFDTNLSLSGAADRIDYFLSVGRSDHDGMIVGENDFFDKTMGRLKATYRPTDEITIRGNVAYTDASGRFIQKGSNVSGLLLGAVRTPPDFNNQQYLSADGFHRSYTNPDPSGRADAWIFDNPFWSINNNRNTSDASRSIVNGTVEYSPVNWLSARYTFGNDYSHDERIEVLPIGNYTWATGFMGKASFVNEQRNHTATATVDRQLTDAVSGSFTAGYERNSREFRRFYVEGLDFIVPGVYSLDNTVNRQSNEFRSLIHAESFFGQATFDIFDQLFVTGAIRNDGFSTFGESERRHWYPKTSVAWEFSRTLGLENSVLSFGKLRAAWGQAGNEPPVYGTVGGNVIGTIADAGWSSTFQPAYSGFGAAFTAFQKAQPDLKPERTGELEVGLDVSLLDDRVGLNATYYNAHTVDAIIRAPLAPSTGHGLQLQNIAEFRNSGVELAVDVRALQTPDATWDVHANWSANDNEVLDLGGRDFVALNGSAFGGAAPFAVVGQSIGVLRGNDFYRCGNSNLPSNVEDSCAGAPSGAVYIGNSGLPVVDPQVRIIADPNPDWLAGVSSTLSLFGNVEIYALVDVKHGGDIWNGTKGALYSYGTHKDTEVRGLEARYGEFEDVPVVGPGADGVVTFDESWFRGLGSGFGPVASQFIEDGGYVKLREVSLAFDVPNVWTQRIGLSGVNLKLAGRNLVTWTDYTGIDPETNLTGTAAVRGYDYFNNPQTRQWIVSVGLTR